MSLSLTLATRNAQFAARFAAQADGSFLYFHPDGQGGGGLPCTSAERTQLLNTFTNTHQRSMRNMMFWTIGSGAVMGVLEASKVLLLPTWTQWGILLMPASFTLRAWHHAQQHPLDVLIGRIPAQPVRTATQARHRRLAALPAQLIAMMLLPAAGLTYYAAETGWEISHALIVTSNVLLAIAWVVARKG